MDYFNPQATTPDAATHNYTVTLADHFTIGRGLLENTLSATQFDARAWAQGTQDLNITPKGNSGNYFAEQNRRASRIGLSSVFAFGSVQALGTHNVKIGSYVAGSSENGQAIERPVNILDSSNHLVERISYSGGQPFRVSDTEFALFGQDHWLINSKLALDVGLRAESQQISQTFRLAPRVGMVWNPFSSSATVVRAGAELFYDRVPLNVYSFDRFPSH